MDLTPPPPPRSLHSIESGGFPQRPLGVTGVKPTVSYRPLAAGSIATSPSPLQQLHAHINTFQLDIIINTVMQYSRCGGVAIDINRLEKLGT